MRLVRAAGAAAALAALLFGVPWFLLAVGDPAYVLEADWATALLVSMDSRLVLALLSVIGWAAWAVIALTVVLEAVALATRHRVTPRLPGTAWLRPAVAALLAALVVSPGVAAADPGPAGTHAVALSSGSESQDGRAAEATAPTTRPYVVRSGDELWSVAQRELGAGERWREVTALNPGLDATSILLPGTTIKLPAGAPAAHTVTVEDGESLWAIAERELGDGARWPEIHRLNAARVADPDVIDVGWELEVPSAAAATATVVPAAAVTEAPAETPSAETPPPDAQEPVEADADPGPAPSVAAPARAAEAETTPGPAESAEPASATMPDDTAGDASALLGPIGAITAAGVLAGLATRRRTQLVGRAIGRRLIPGSPELARFWTALAGRAATDGPEPDSPGPTSLILGWAPDDEPVLLDLERERATVLTGPESASALAAAITGLACAPWSDGVDVIVADAPEWGEALDDPRITSHDTVGLALAELIRLCSSRRLALGRSTLAEVRADPERAAAWAPTVVVLAAPPTPLQWDGISDALALGEVGVSVLAVGERPHVDARVVDVTAAEGTWDGVAFSPQLVDRPAKRALLELFELTGTPLTEPAPWWADESSNVHPLPLPPEPEEALDMTAPPGLPEHPGLRLLGEVQLDGAAGPTPSRAVGQCLEYCTWLLEHPSSSPTAMARALLVAEPTRRSNMSRLRGWLGVAPDGENYLPDAYSGRIRLDERVTSDWERFRAILSGGVNLAPDSALIEALHLVQGEPLGSFAFQWAWAYQLRADMVSMIVDAACCLADRALERDDPALALWAVERGRLASPDSDEVGTREVLTHERAGRHDEAERTALRLSRAARAQGRDIAPDLARRIQLALHGGPARPPAAHVRP